MQLRPRSRNEQVAALNRTKTGPGSERGRGSMPESFQEILASIPYKQHIIQINKSQTWHDDDDDDESWFVSVKEELGNATL